MIGKRIFSLLVVWIFGLIITFIFLFFKGATANELGRQTKQYTGLKEKISYRDNVIIAEGIGHPPPFVKKGSPRARLLAQRAATVRAYRNLAKVVGKMYKEKTITGIERINIKGFIRGAEVKEIKHFSDGSCRVVIELPFSM